MLGCIEVRGHMFGGLSAMRFLEALRFLEAFWRVLGALGFFEPFGCLGVMGFLEAPKFWEAFVVLEACWSLDAFRFLDAIGGTCCL